MAGFSFAGVHSETYGCHYRPDAKARGDRMADYSVSASSDESRDGGYYIGTRVEPRTFALDCYFEDISAVQLAGIRQWLRRDKQGELIFDGREWAIYDVVTAKKVEITLYDCRDTDGVRRYSGTFTAHFTAYEPFARMREVSYEGAGNESE